MTDNITPQAPHAAAPMTTDEIVSRLGRLEACCVLEVPGNITAQDTKALTAAVQAVELLEKIKAELRGNCSGCKYGNLPTYKEPCLGCACDDGNGDNWEWRWPLGEEADHETH